MAGDLDLPSPPPPPTRAPRLVSLQSKPPSTALPPTVAAPALPPAAAGSPAPTVRSARFHRPPAAASLAGVGWRSTRKRGCSLLLVRVSSSASLEWDGMDSLVLLVCFVFLLQSNPSVSISRFVSSRIPFAAWRCDNLDPADFAYLSL